MRARTVFYTLLRSFRPFCSCSLSLSLSLLTLSRTVMATEASTSQQLRDVLDAVRNIESNVDAKLTQMKRELKEERESADERLVKKIRLDSKPTFQKRGHEKQFMFNEQI